MISLLKNGPSSLPRYDFHRWVCLLKNFNTVVLRFQPFLTWQWGIVSYLHKQTIKWKIVDCTVVKTMILSGKYQPFWIWTLRIIHRFGQVVVDVSFNWWSQPWNISKRILIQFTILSFKPHLYKSCLLIVTLSILMWCFVSKNI